MIIDISVFEYLEERNATHDSAPFSEFQVPTDLVVRIVVDEARDTCEQAPTSTLRKLYRIARNLTTLVVNVTDVQEDADESKVLLEECAKRILSLSARENGISTDGYEQSARSIQNGSALFMVCVLYLSIRATMAWPHSVAVLSFPVWIILLFLISSVEETSDNASPTLQGEDPGHVSGVVIDLERRILCANDKNSKWLVSYPLHHVLGFRVSRNIICLDTERDPESLQPNVTRTFQIEMLVLGKSFRFVPAESLACAEEICEELNTFLYHGPSKHMESTSRLVDISETSVILGRERPKPYTSDIYQAQRISPMIVRCVSWNKAGSFQYLMCFLSVLILFIVRGPLYCCFRIASRTQRLLTE